MSSRGWTTRSALSIGAALLRRLKRLKEQHPSARGLQRRSGADGVVEETDTSQAMPLSRPSPRSTRSAMRVPLAAAYYVGGVLGPLLRDNKLLLTSANLMAHLSNENIAPPMTQERPWRIDIQRDTALDFIVTSRPGPEFEAMLPENLSYRPGPEGEALKPGLPALRRPCALSTATRRPAHQHPEGGHRQRIPGRFSMASRQHLQTQADKRSLRRPLLGKSSMAQTSRTRRGAATLKLGRHTTRRDPYQWSHHTHRNPSSGPALNVLRP